MLFTDVLDNAEDKDLWKNMAIDHSELKKKWVKTWKYKMNLKNFVSPTYKEVLKIKQWWGYVKETLKPTEHPNGKN